MAAVDDSQKSGSTQTDKTRYLWTSLVDVCAVSRLPVDDMHSSSEHRPLLHHSPHAAGHDLSRRKRTVRLLKLVYFAIVACSGGLGFGMTAVFSSPLLDDLVDSNLTQWKDGFSTDECAYQILIGPISPIIAIVGGLVTAPLTAVTGFVTGMVLTAAVNLAGWIMLGCSYFITSPYAFRGVLLTGRAFTGFAMGFGAASVPVYIAEIAPAKIRGTLGGFFQMSVVTGSLLGFVVGGLLQYWIAAFVFAAIFPVSIVLLFTVKESPSRSRNPLKNVKSLTVRHTQNANPKQSLSLPWSGYAWRLGLVVFVQTFQQITGVNAIAFYGGPILQSAGWNNPSISADLAVSIAIGVMQILPVFMSIFLVDRLGRRIMLFAGAAGIALAHFGMVVYFSVSFGILPEQVIASNSSSCFQHGLSGSAEAQQLEALPLVSIAVFFIAFSLSWGPISWTFTAEILPMKIRTLGNSIGVATNWFWASFVTLLFPIVSGSVGFAIPFLFFAILSIVSGVFVVFFLPETRGLTLQESNALKFSMRRNVKEFMRILRYYVFCECGKRSVSTKVPATGVQSYRALTTDEPLSSIH